MTTCKKCIELQDEINDLKKEVFGYHNLVKAKDRIIDELQQILLAAETGESYDQRDVLDT